MFKVGLGQDSHILKVKTQKFQAAGGQAKVKSNKNLILGGVEVSKDYYLEADSDGDVIIHALCNALSTAIGGGSLDTWAGPMFKRGITDSKEFLKVIWHKVTTQGYKVGNIVVMLEGKRPRLEPAREKIQLSLASLLNIKKEDVGIAFTTGEGLTAFGKGEGIQVLTIVLLQK